MRPPLSLTVLAPVALLCLAGPAAAPASAQAPAAPEAAPAVLRFVDVTGDGLHDRLVASGDGALSVEVNLGGRVFRPVVQELPRVTPVDVLVADLDRNGFVDLYLVCDGPNAALWGDGTGRFRDVTGSLGLVDAGSGRSAELHDLDGDGLPDLLLHNASSDVLFWARHDGLYDRDPQSPVSALSAGGAGEAGEGAGITSGGAGPGVESGNTGAGAAKDAPVPTPFGASSAALLPPPIPGGTVGAGSSLAGTGATSSRPKTVDPNTLISLFDQRYVNDDGNEVDSADVVDGSLTGADISTSSGDVSHTGGNMGLGAGAVSVAKLYVLQPNAGGMAIRATSSPSNGTGRALVAIAAGSGSKAVDAWASSPTGTTFGMHSQNDSINGTAVYGNAAATTGNTIGVHGTAASPDGIAVQGHAASTSGSTTGVLGIVDSTEGVGVTGQATALSGETVGVFGTIDSYEGAGVVGEATSLTGFANGVEALSVSPGATGVWARHGALTPAGWEGWFTPGSAISASANDGAEVAVAGIADTGTSSSLGWGVYGHSMPDYGVGVYGLADSLTGTTVGVVGHVESDAGVGVRAEAVAVSGSTLGLDATVSSPDGRAIQATNMAVGTLGELPLGVVSEVTDGMAVALVGSNHGGVPGSAGVVVGGSGVSGATTVDGGVGTAGLSYSSLGTGVYGYTASPDGTGTGVWGSAASTSGAEVGVMGESFSPDGVAIRAENLSNGSGGNSTTTALSVESFGDGAVAVDVTTDSPPGSAYVGVGLWATTRTQPGAYGVALIGMVDQQDLSDLGIGIGAISGNSEAAEPGVIGWNFRPSGAALGVAGLTESPNGQGVLGSGGPMTLPGGAVLSAGVRGDASGSSVAGVYGINTHTLLTSSHGVVGETLSPVSSGVHSVGDMTATGVKWFVQPHPSDASREVRFISLEGNESGTYFRGSSELVGGRAIIAVPEEFRLVSETDGLTVQLTPMGADARLWIESRDLEQVVVRGAPDVSFDYFVNGIRRGFADVSLMRENTSFVPSVRGAPFGTQYPEALRQLLVENGTLNSDFTPNEATAASMGWVLGEARNVRSELRMVERPVAPPGKSAKRPAPPLIKLKETKLPMEGAGRSQARPQIQRRATGRAAQARSPDQPAGLADRTALGTRPPG